MGILDDKKEIFSNIAALRTSCEGFPKFNLSSSLESVDNCSNSLDFLTDLLKSLVGFEKLREIVVDTLVFDLDDIESEIKKTLKRELKSLVSCGVNPSIPDSILHQNVNPASTGINLDLRKVDFLGVMLVDPTSDEGKLLYQDPLAGLNSTDFNTYLYQTVQEDGTQTDWGSQTLGSPKDVLSIEFNSVGATNNTLNVKVSEYYSNPTNNKKLTDVNNDFIDSVNLFGSQQMLNNIIDMIFGSISFSINKTSKQLETEAEIESIIDCILNSNEDDVIDNSYFTFSNEQIRDIKSVADQRKNGYKVLHNCSNVISEIPIDDLIAINTEFSGATTKVEEFEIVKKSVDDLADIAANNAPASDNYTAKLSFIDDIIKKFMKAIINLILSPKLIAIFAINHQIIYSTEFSSALDFLEKNKTFLKGIVDSVRDIIIDKLLKEVLKEIKDLVACNAINIATEYAKSRSAVLGSLVGIPQDIIRVIRGI